MTNKILKSILSVAAVVLLSSLVIITGVLYQYFGNVQQSQLKDELTLAAKATEALGESYLDGLDDATYRLTWVAEDGTVLFDNQIDEKNMENHADREEIREALLDGNGSSSRYSTTLTEQNLYEAVRLSDGSVLRISESRATALVLIFGMLQPIALIIAIVLGVSIVLANRMAKNVVQINGEQNRREFTANVSHELKTPLQSIIGSAELLEAGIVKPEDQQRFVGHIRKEASRLLCLIDDIIRLSQLDEGAEMPMEEVPLRVLAQEVAETLENAAKEKEIALEVTGTDGIMKGVRRLLYEIIYNLCDNAIKYNHINGTVKLQIIDQQENVCLKVADTGIGIAPEDQEKIFERFYRVDKSHSKQSGGTGLGLSIVKHAVQYHHGTLTMTSAIGQGTEISILFKKNAE